MDLKAIIHSGMISTEQIKEIEAVDRHFHVRVPASLGSEIWLKKPGIARQFLPSSQELIFFPEELEDPIGDKIWEPVAGVVHRYPDRALLKVTTTCAAYCRFCFRREHIAQNGRSLDANTLEQAFEYLTQNPNIWELVLTGGDPLVLTDQALSRLFDRMRAIQHIKIVRFHSRMVSIRPERIHSRLIEMLQQTNKSIWFAAHINSADELTPAACQALRRLINGGVSVVAQSVLLKGVNDTVQTLTDLLRGLVEIGVKPYYLHYPDLARGTAHFRIPLDEAIELVARLRGRLSGLCLPQFIVDIPGGRGKIAVEKNRAFQIDAETWRFESPLDQSSVVVRYPRG